MIDGKKNFEQKCQLLRFNLTRQNSDIRYVSISALELSI